jgi:diguanylate cyclase (GGDEF)-like protein/PAS domain S-box-containing protein
MNKPIQHENVLDALENGIVLFDEFFHVVYANRTCLSWLKASSAKDLESCLHDPEWHLLDASGQPLPKEHFPAHKVIATGQSSYNVEIGIPDPDPNINVYYWFLCDAYFVNKKVGLEPGKVIVTLTRVESHKELIPFRKIVENANDAVIVTEADKNKASNNPIVYVNKRVVSLTGFQKEEVLGQSTELFRGDKTSPITSQRIHDNMAAGKSIREEIVNYKKDGTPYWVDVNLVPLFNDRQEMTHYAAIERDVTKNKGKANNLERLANTDTLTEVLNRRGLYKQGDRIISSSYEANHAFILAILDIDKFKPINDTYGHPVGDLVLKGVADALKDSLRSRDMIARLGGEEFVIVIEGEPLPVLIKRIEDLRQIIQTTPFEINEDLTINITASFGVAISGNKPHSLDELIEYADVALYRSKQNGRNQVTVNKNFELEHPAT